MRFRNQFKTGAARASTVLSVLGSACLGINSAETQIGEHKFTHADELEIELVAGTPVIDRPIVADFDEQGRLYVAESSGSNDNVQKQLQERPHKIVRLEDADGDGKFEKRVVFADKMMFPEGTMWHDGSVYVSAPPSIWKLTDTDGDGRADKREEWLDAKTLTGCANDLHGPYAGPDGWIYWCKGAFAEQSYERAGKKPFKTRAAHIFRRRPEGGEIEAVMTGGMDNPVDVVFTPEGERIFTTTFFQHPGGGQRDGLIHAIYGGVYGKVHDVIEDHKRTGEIMPVLTHLGPAAPSGLVRLESSSMGQGYKNSLLACNFNLRKVTRHTLSAKGASFQSNDSDFVVSDNGDFHPTDVIEDADGSVLIINTGGWYKLCCPTSQLYKPDVLGGIYRVKRKGAKVEDFRRTKSQQEWNLAAGQLAKLLQDERPAVRKHASALLAKQGDEAVKAIMARGPAREVRDFRQATDLDVSLEKIWALTKINSPAARAAIREMMNSQMSDSARQAGLHAVSVWKDREALGIAMDNLNHSNPHVRRAAAEALGRLESNRAVRAILKAAETLEGSSIDRVLEHSLIYALIEIGDGAGTAQGLSSQSAMVRRVSLIALDQMESSPLKATQVTGLFSTKEATIRDAAFWIVRRHLEWGGELIPYFKDELGKANGATEDLLAHFARNSEIQEFMAEALPRSEVRARRIILRAMSRSGVKEPPMSWQDVLAAALGEKETAAEAVATARALPFKREKASELAVRLENLGSDQGAETRLRLEALASVPGGVQEVTGSIFDFLAGHLGTQIASDLRSSAATALAKSRLSGEQLVALAERLKSVGPVELPRILPVFENSSSEQVGRALIGALESSGAIRWISREQLNKHLSKYPASVKELAGEASANSNEDSEKQREHLDQLLAEMKDGDIRRGQAVFNSEKAACASCHAIGYLGGNMGPDLTRIGQIRNERDLLEAIIYPSASFVRSYEPVIVVTRDDEQYSGVLRKDAPDEVVVATGPGTETSVKRSEVVSLRPGTVSVMPQGLDQQLNKQEMADLLAFLKATRW